MTTNYARGAALERRVKARLEDDGYDVWRTPGSKSLVDLIAIRDGAVLFVQVKLGARGMSGRERIDLVDFAAKHRAGAIEARQEGQRKPIKWNVLIERRAA